MAASKGSALLAKWRSKNGKLSQLALAELLQERDEKVRASQASVSNWETGLLDPPARVVVLLESLTDGFVTAASWFKPDDEVPTDAVESTPNEAA